ncbi:MAG: glycoside hydrolase family 43 protein [Clostridia bacterium]|nr:glycoside hydrolase family 43 protein [Clostridia bacterium]
MIITDITRIGDPQILVWEGKYYCYATSSGEGFLCWESEDLVNWSEPKLCFRAIDSWGESHFWAPEVVAHNGKIVMHYTAKSRELKSLRLGVAVADHPMGPFTDVHGKPMFDFGYAAIDGSVLVCEEGNYFYFSRDCSENLIGVNHVSQTYCAKMNDDLTELVEKPRLMTTPTEMWERKSGNWLWNEGPCVIYRDGKYIMNYSANFYASNDYAICVATADHPMGPWKKSVNNPVLSRRGDLFGAGHNAFFTGLDGQLYTAFHIQTNPDKPSGNRRTVIGKVEFSEKNGEIYQTIE